MNIYGVRYSFWHDSDSTLEKVLAIRELTVRK